MVADYSYNKYSMKAWPTCMRREAGSDAIFASQGTTPLSSSHVSLQSQVAVTVVSCGNGVVA